MAPGGPGGPNLVMVESVQEDLALTDKQKDALKKLEATMRQKGRQAFEQAGQGGFDPETMRATLKITGDSIQFRRGEVVRFALTTLRSRKR